MYTSEQIENYVEDFEAGALSRDVFTHEAHLLVAVSYVDKFNNVDQALDVMRTSLVRLNNANDVPNTGVSGYHETVTRFMLLSIEYFLYTLPETFNLTEKVNAVLESELSLSKFPFFFYSHDLLQSFEARQGWVEPDLRPLSDLSKLLMKGSGI